MEDKSSSDDQRRDGSRHSDVSTRPATGSRDSDEIDKEAGRGVQRKQRMSRRANRDSVEGAEGGDPNGRRPEAGGVGEPSADEERTQSNYGPHWPRSEAGKRLLDENRSAETTTDEETED